MDHVHKVSMWRHERHYASERTTAVMPNCKLLSRSSPRSRMVPCISEPASSTCLPSKDLFWTILREKHDLRHCTPLSFCLDLRISSACPVRLAFSVGQA